MNTEWSGSVHLPQHVPIQLDATSKTHMRTWKIVSYSVVLVLAVYATIFVHAFNAFSNKGGGSTTAASGVATAP
jgi:hypothetical protein